MTLTIIRQDITKLPVDAIVNAANTELRMGGGVCGAIFNAAGPDKLVKACQKLSPIQTGQAVITPAFKLPAKYIIHTAGPVYRDGNHNEAALLKACYTNSLQLAIKARCKSIAFPLIASGIFGYPKAAALQIATNAIEEFLRQNELEVYLVVFDSDAVEISEKLLGDVKKYIDQHYVDQFAADHYRLHNWAASLLPDASWRDIEPLATSEEIAADWYESFDSAPPPSAAPAPSPAAAPAQTPPASPEPLFARKSAPVVTHSIQGVGAAFSSQRLATAKPQRLEDMLAHLDESFATSLLKLIDQRGKTDVEVYKKANIDRKLFNKIKADNGYKTSKKTVLALAVALELNEAETDALLRKAGFALSNNQLFDVIIQYFLQNRKFNIFEINNVLFQYDQPLLGG